MNPQFTIKLDDVDDDPDDGQEGCTVIVGLMQKNKRRRRKMGEDMETIGYAIYDVRAFSHILMLLSFHGLKYASSYSSKAPSSHNQDLPYVQTKTKQLKKWV